MDVDCGLESSDFSRLKIDPMRSIVILSVFPIFTTLIISLPDIISTLLVVDRHLDVDCGLESSDFSRQKIDPMRSVVIHSVFPIAGLVRRGGSASEEQDEASGVRSDGKDLPLLGQSHVSLQASRPLVWQTG